MKPQAVFLDAATLGDDLSLEPLSAAAAISIYPVTGEQEVEERCRGAAVVITNKVVFTRERLQALQEHLRLICLTATGFNNVDVKAARELGITVCNVKGYSTDSVAQHTLAISLSLLQQIRYYADFVHDGSYAHAPVFTHFGRPWYEVTGKTWGIIGMGAIGSRTAGIVQSLGCEVIYYSSSGKDRDTRYARAELDELLAKSHIISIHAPLNNRTKGLIGKRELALMKPDAILVNVGRGGIVDEQDLAEALVHGRIRGAAIDVFVNEPIEQNSALLEVPHDRLLMTPHIAWGSIEARQRVVEGVVHNIQQFMLGTPTNVVG